MEDQTPLSWMIAALATVSAVVATAGIILGTGTVAIAGVLSMTVVLIIVGLRGAAEQSRTDSVKRAPASESAKKAA